MAAQKLKDGIFSGLTPIEIAQILTEVVVGTFAGGLPGFLLFLSNALKVTGGLLMATSWPSVPAAPLGTPHGMVRRYVNNGDPITDLSSWSGGGMLGTTTTYHYTYDTSTAGMFYPHSPYLGAFLRSQQERNTNFIALTNLLPDLITLGFDVNVTQLKWLVAGALPIGEGPRYDLFYKSLVQAELLNSYVPGSRGWVDAFLQDLNALSLSHPSMTAGDVLAIGLLIVTLFETVIGWLRSYIFTHTACRIDVELSARLFQHLVRLPLAYFQVRRVGDSVARIRELENIRSFLTSSALTLVIDLLFSVVFLIVMFFYSWQLFLIVLGSLPFYALISIAVTPSLRQSLDDKFSRGAENQSFLVETVTGIETLKAAAVEPQMQGRWERQVAGYIASGFRSSMLGMSGGQAVQLINRLVTLLILYVGARLVMNDVLSVGQLVAFNMLAGQISGPVLRLAQLWQDFQQFRVSIDRLGDILNTPSEPHAAAGSSQATTLVGNITLEDVVFRYQPGGKEILCKVSLSIPAGEILGIVGPSGSGKSTLTKLVQRLYIPESGRVLVDGSDLALIDPVWLRRQIGVVLQENILFSRSIRDNIALADPGMSMDQVIHAAKLAGAHDFILEMSHGYDTEVGERGVSLSGGQRQRIAIARALATNPGILIFDEATSALDAESEAIIHQNLRSIAAGRTVIIIAHRLSAVRQAHRIVTLEAGRIVEEGTHDELLAAGGRYAALYRMQVGHG